MHGPALIAVGLAVLAAAMIWPAVPAVAAMAVVALGATGVTLARVRRAPAFLPTILLHLAIYSGLYALFVGATLHAVATQAAGAGGLSAVQGIDLAVSLVSMATAWRITFSAFDRTAGGEDAPAR
jgi:hypothetical protein